MKNRILTMKQMQELKELGIDTSKASHVIDCKRNIILGNDEQIINVLRREIIMELIPTYTLQDILEMLNKNKSRYQVCVNYSYNLIKLIDDNGYEPVETVVEFHEDDIMTSAFKAVKWCLDNNEFEF